MARRFVRAHRRDPTGIGGVIARYGDQREMELLVQAGFSPSESVAIYSSHAAKYLGRENIIGTVVPGMQADLLLLDGDFEHDVSINRKPEIVFKEGIGWDSAKLQASGGYRRKALGRIAAVVVQTNRLTASA